MRGSIPERVPGKADLILTGYDGPISLEPETDELNQAFHQLADSYAGAADEPHQAEILENKVYYAAAEIPGFQGGSSAPITDNGDVWFFALHFITDLGQIKILFPSSADQAIAIYREVNVTMKKIREILKDLTKRISARIKSSTE